MPSPRPGLPDPFPAAVTVASTLDGQFQQVYLFVTTKAMLDKVAPSAVEALAIDGLLWVCFPKGTSGMQTDLTRDEGWDILKKLRMQFIHLISLDATWSAFGLRKRAGAFERSSRTSNHQTATAARKFIDKEKTIVNAPPDLRKALSKSKKAKASFDALAFTHKKEYVEWILQAKKEETRQRRIAGIIKRLTSGLKNPWANG